MAYSSGKKGGYKKGNKFARDFYNGIKYGESLVRKANDEVGYTGFEKAYKAQNTCLGYAYGKNMRYTKQGQVLTPDKKAFYAGVSRGIENGFGRFLG